MQQALTPAAQRFIFKHELGHVFYNFSYKSLLRVGAIGALATYGALSAAYPVLNRCSGLLAVVVGLCVGMVADLCLTWLSNVVFKLREEKKADLFAARFSSREDIQAAAHFFEQHQIILDTHKDPNNKLSFLPSVITTGHPNGNDRARYLRRLSGH